MRLPSYLAAPRTRWKDALPWDGVSNFTHGPGMNLARLGFDRYIPWNTPTHAKGIWNTHLGEVTATTGQTHWQEILAAEADVIRIAIDPQVFLETDGSDAALAPWVDVIRHCVDDVLAHGLKAIVDMHIPAGGDEGPEGDTAIRASFAAGGPLWLKVKKVWVAIAKMLNQYETDEVAFELYNETTTYDPSVYVPMIVELHRHIRAIVGPRTKHIIASYGYANFHGFEAGNGFTRNRFGPNVGFASHSGYFPSAFSHQNAGGVVPVQYFHRLPFFAVEADRAATIAAALAEATADGASDATKAAISHELNYYFDQWVANQVWDGTKLFPSSYTMGTIYGSAVPGETKPANMGNYIGLWMLKNGVSGDDMHMTEIGTNSDFRHDLVPTLGGDTESRARFISLHRRYFCDARGGNGMIFWGDKQDFSYRKNIAAPGGYPNLAGPYEPLLMVAGRFRANWTPSLLGDKLIQFLDTTDMATITFGSGTAVAAILDKSGAGNHEVQLDAGSRLNWSGGYLVQPGNGYLDSPLSASRDDEPIGIFQIVVVTSFAGTNTIVGASAGAGRQWRTEASGLSTVRQGTSYKSGFNYVPVLNQPCLLGVQYGGPGNSSPPDEPGTDFTETHAYHFNMTENSGLYPLAGDPPPGLTSTTGALPAVYAPNQEPFAGKLGSRIVTRGALSEDEIEQLKLYLMRLHDIID